MAEVVRTITSDGGMYRALVVQYAEGVFRVAVQQWTEGHRGAGSPKNESCPAVCCIAWFGVLGAQVPAALTLLQLRSTPGRGTGHRLQATAHFGEPGPGPRPVGVPYPPDATASSPPAPNAAATLSNTRRSAP